MSKSEIRDAIKTWGCLGKFGFGQGKAVATFGEEKAGEGVCYRVCPKSDECRDLHHDNMDILYPEVADLVKRTVINATQAGIPVMPTVVSAMNIAVKRKMPEAIRIRQGLTKYRVDGMVDHYVFGQLENLDNGVSGRSPNTKPVFLLSSNVDSVLLSKFNKSISG